jgi:DNA-binding NtrC family response regulator
MELAHAAAMSAHRQANLSGNISRSVEPAPAAPAGHPAPADSANGARPHGRPTPAELAIAAAEAGNYSLKDVSREAARQAERELIARMLQQTRWNRKETAEILGISYKALLYKIKENGLDKAS